MPTLTRNTALSADGGPSGNAHHDKESSISSRLGVASPVSASLMFPGARS